MKFPTYISLYLEKSTSSSVLAIFRITIGMLLFITVGRFWGNGWVEDLYITPKHFFPYYGFEFVKPLGVYTYWLFAACGASALMVALGWYYRVAIVTLFLSFTYIELIDKATYLNHYYFISMVCLLMIFLPAHASLSVDAHRNKSLSYTAVPQWNVDILKAFISILYLYAGMAKINSDWLLHALPLKIWLPARNDMPIIGFLLNKSWVHFAFSWIGCLYDLSIPFFLWNRKTTYWAFGVVILFHVLTALLFPIGMFPYIMITSALIFFPASFHKVIVRKITHLLTQQNTHNTLEHKLLTYEPFTKKLLIVAFIIFLVTQLLVPLRDKLYPGQLFWTEQGYRFSWRVMLMEKAGYAQFIVKDAKGRKAYVNNSNFLTTLQEKMMSTQPDMILQYAHILRNHYTTRGFVSPQVYVDSYVSLNGELGKRMVAPNTDLALEKESFKHKDWIILYNE